MPFAAVSWVEAKNYCNGLTLGGHTDWGLARIVDLEALYDRGVSYVLPQFTGPDVPPAAVALVTVHIKAPIRLTGMMVWSADEADAIQMKGWGLTFGTRERLSESGELIKVLYRALCVRVP